MFLVLKFVLSVLRYHRRRVFGCVAPFLLAPLPLLVETPDVRGEFREGETENLFCRKYHSNKRKLKTANLEARCGYVILLMACYWVVEPIPVAATSLLPVVLFPLLGVLSTNEASSEYMNGTNMMFVGGLFMAVAIEECNLHKRIALTVLRWVGPTASWMMFGFMATSMFLSMWISNTATTALMVPIIEAVMVEMGDKAIKDDSSSLKKISVISVEARKASADPHCSEIDGNHCSRSAVAESIGSRSSMIGVVKRAMFLSVAYSANIGGTGTLTGTGPNLVLKSVTEKLFPDCTDVSFDKWMMYNIPVMLMCILIAWMYLFLVHIRKASSIYTPELKESLNAIIKKRHAELGPMTFKEKAVSILFFLLVMLWIFRNPQFISGWGSYFPVKIGDATPAIGIPILLFMIPSEPSKLGKSRPLLQWQTLQNKVPWGVILLLGGGFSLATASEKSGLSRWMTEQLLSLHISSPLAVVSLLSIMTATLTEFTSNVATANVLLPVVAELALAMKINPLYMMIPVTISCSFAFMLPVATPPNAIVYEAGGMSTMDMLKPGFLMNLMCVGIEVLMISTYGKLIFDFDRFPRWAEKSYFPQYP